MTFDDRPSPERALVPIDISACGEKSPAIRQLRERDDVVLADCLMHSTLIEVNGVIQQSTPKDYEAGSIPVPAFILEQLAVQVSCKPKDDRVFVSSKAGGVLRNGNFRRGWF